MIDLITNSEIEKLKVQIINHPVFDRMENLEHVNVFMEHHVYAVWDFMFLLKRLQQEFSCTDCMWLPKGTPSVRNFINEIVLAEESDSAVGGKSHFEWYLDAMKQAEANTGPIITLLAQRATKKDEYQLPEGIKIHGMNHFMLTENLAKYGKIYEVAAVFAVARENLIPKMFSSIVDNISNKFPGYLTYLIEYMDRHIELDGDKHGPMADKLLKACIQEGDTRAMEECISAVEKALRARLKLWDSIFKEIV